MSFYYTFKFKFTLLFIKIKTKERDNKTIFNFYYLALNNKHLPLAISHLR